MASLLKWQQDSLARIFNICIKNGLIWGSQAKYVPPIPLLRKILFIPPWIPSLCSFSKQCNPLRSSPAYLRRTSWYWRVYSERPVASSLVFLIHSSWELYQRDVLSWFYRWGNQASLTWHQLLKVHQDGFTYRNFRGFGILGPFRKRIVSYLRERPHARSDML